MRWKESWAVEAPVEAIDPEGELHTFRIMVELTDGLMAIIVANRFGDEEVDAYLASIRDWADVVDLNGQPIPWSDERREQIKRRPWLLAGIIKAIVEKAMEVRKNS